MSIEGQNIDELAANKDKPLVMAYIGDDDPHRGDTKGTIGISKLVAEMICGRYVYVDFDMLDKHFAQDGKRLKDGSGDIGAFRKRIADRFFKLCSRIGSPDVMIGSPSRIIMDDLWPSGIKPPHVVESQLNEWIAESRAGTAYLVSHHLSKELLEDEAKKFKNQYPDIKGELCTVMMGGEVYKSDCWENSSIKSVALKLLDISAHYDDITFFICPSRRTRVSYIHLMEELAVHMGIGVNREQFLKQIDEGTSFECGNIRVVGLSFRAAKKSYNPYLGLLGCADHIVQVGDSGSITSEALYTDKTVYLSNAYMPERLLKTGHIISLDNLKNAPFPTKAALLSDITYAVASDIAKEFKQKAYGQVANLPVPMEAYDLVKKAIGAPAIT